jgi:hypothetical protein
MGGRTAGDLRDGLFKPLSREFPDVQFDIFWLRESFGFEEISRGGGVALRTPKGTVGESSPFADQIRTHFQEVRLVLGDDMDIVFTPGSTEPIRIFNDRGEIIATFAPGPGETTREVMVRLMSGELHL